MAVKETYPVTGMSCASCAVSVESMLKSRQGVSDAGVNFANSTAFAEYDPDVVTPQQLQKAVQSIGYNLIIESEDPYAEQEEREKEEYQKVKRRFIGAVAFALPVFLIGMFFPNLLYGRWISLILTIPVLFIFGAHFFKNSWKLALHGSTNMDTLVALSTGIAFLFSAFNTFYPQFFESRGFEAHVYFEAAAVIIAFISLGKWLEEKAKSNTSSALKKLIGLQPKFVKVIIDEKEIEMAVADVETGQVVMVRPGEKIPLDGEVTIGNSYVDESMISGEPVPVKKSKGEKVFAGTINQKGAFRFAATKASNETLLAQIIQTVRDAQGSKAPVQKMADRIAGIFVPTVIGLAFLTFTAWMVFGGENAFTHALLASISVLVIACPCALGLATPTAIMVGVGKGAENGILIKDAESLEMANKTDVVVLDKTGTITEGKPSLVESWWIESEIGNKELGVGNRELEVTTAIHKPQTSELKSVLYALELQSEHPLALAVTEALKKETEKQPEVGHFESLTGQGLKGEVDGKTYFVGNHKLMESEEIAIPRGVRERTAEWQSKAQTVVYFSDENEVLAILSIADAIKESSAVAIQKLQLAGLQVHMLTGDNHETAKAVSHQVGLEKFKAEVLPLDKAQFIKELQSQGKVVAMVGDGINDSTALAQADVSIAMGKGSDIAMDVAKITLISSDLLLLPKAFRLSQKTVAGIRQNLFWAFIYNLIGIPIAAGILYPFTGFLLNPMIAGAAMAFSSVSVVLNSLRLKGARLE